MVLGNFGGNTQRLRARPTPYYQRERGTASYKPKQRLENGSYSCGAAAREWFDPLWDTLTSQGRESEIGGREVRTLDLNGSREC
jgi:hypothetical protein